MLKGKLSTRKDTKKNLESRISTLEKEVSKWKAIAKELQVFLDPFFFHITSAFFADIRTCTFHSTVRAHYSEI
jgi:CII-binding regulator of phage lambda lysogenization HflD